MSVADIKEQAKQLTREERHQLTAFLVSLNMQEEGGFERISAKLDSEKSEWVSWEDAEAELDRLDGRQAG